MAFVGPERHSRVPRRPCKPHTFRQKPFAQPQTTASIIDKKQSQLCGVPVVAHAEDAPEPLSLLFRNPTTFAIRVMSGKEITKDTVHQRPEGRIEPFVTGVERLMALNDPGSVEFGRGAQGYLGVHASI